MCDALGVRTADQSMAVVASLASTIRAVPAPEDCPCIACTLEIRQSTLFKAIDLDTDSKKEKLLIQLVQVLLLMPLMHNQAHGITSWLKEKLTNFYSEEIQQSSGNSERLVIYLRDKLRAYTELECLIQYAGTMPIQSLLDVGCNYGDITALINHLLMPTALTAIDPFTSTFSGYANGRSRSDPDNYIAYIKSFVPKISFHKQSLQEYATTIPQHDLIIINGYGVPVEETADFFRALANVLTPQGKAIITYYEDQRFSDLNRLGYRLSSLVFATFTDVMWCRAYPGEVSDNLYKQLLKQLITCSQEDRRYLLDSMIDGGVYCCVISKPRPDAKIKSLLQLPPDELSRQERKGINAYLTPTSVLDSSPYRFLTPAREYVLSTDEIIASNKQIAAYPWLSCELRELPNHPPKSVRSSP